MIHCILAVTMNIKKIIFLLAVAVAAASAAKEALVSTSVKSSPFAAFVKLEINCLKKQLSLCKSLLITANKNCKIPTPRAPQNIPTPPPVSKDCKDVYETGNRKNGIYTIDPDSSGKPFKVYCNMEIDNGGWTVIQRRQDGSENFFRNWDDYANGFGDLNGEHWLGLEKIYRLTASSSNTLRVDVGEYDGRRAYAKFNSFKLGNTATKYSLYVSGYSGSAGDALSYHNGMKFSTRDNDNDIWNRNCASRGKGGWWYRNCDKSNLNGLFAGSRLSGYQYMTWQTFTRGCYAIKFSEMKVRRS